MTVSITPAASRKLAALKQPLLDMPPAEALTFIHTLRARRLRPERPIKAPRAAALKKPAKPKKPKDLPDAQNQ